MSRAFTNKHSDMSIKDMAAELYTYFCHKRIAGLKQELAARHSLAALASNSNKDQRPTPSPYNPDSASAPQLEGLNAEAAAALVRDLPKDSA